MRADALAINCYRGSEVLERLGYPADTKVARLCADLNVNSWKGVLEKVFGP